MDQMDFDFIINHLGENRDSYMGAVCPPIFQTSNFSFKTVEEFRKAFENEQNSHIYTRGNNPTVEVLRKKLAAMENTEDALVFSSGIAAISATVIAFLRQGDHVVCINKPYSWTRHLFDVILKRFGIDVSYFDPEIPEHYKAQCRDNTRLIFIESPCSLTFACMDLTEVAEFATKKGIKTLIDNSHCSPLFQQPSKFGIDLILHSATKYINGHSDVVAGVVCGKSEDISKIFRNEYMTLGACISPMDASLLIRGLRTYKLRLMQSHEGGLQVAKWLKKHPKVERLMHPFLDRDESNQSLMQQMSGTGGLFAFYLKTTSLESCEKFSNRLKKFLMAVSWGGHESLILPGAAFTKNAEIKPGSLPFQYFRLYIGLEDPEILIRDLEQALEVV